MITAIVFFWIFAFIIFFAMVGYPASLFAIKKLLKPKDMLKDYALEPTVTLIIVAHNEQKVIREKLENVLEIDYPANKIEIVVASDNSTDDTNRIVKDFIAANSTRNIRLFMAKERKGKTNAQNEAVATVQGEIIVMTDANAMLETNCVRELTAAFTADDIAYVTGRLCYTNQEAGTTSASESSYWDIDLSMRKIESDIQTITAGNGAIYACRRSAYHNFEPIASHDSSMPLYYALHQKRALFNKDAVAYEKAGESISDEFGRKVRMNRIMFRGIMPSLKLLNVFKYKWFTYFYIGHRTARYMLGFSHCLLLGLSVVLATQYTLYLVALAVQVGFYTIGIIRHEWKGGNKITDMIYYYCVTLLAQLCGAWRIVTGKAKPFWEKAESTR